MTDETKTYRSAALDRIEAQLASQEKRIEIIQRRLDVLQELPASMNASSWSFTAASR